MRYNFFLLFFFLFFLNKHGVASTLIVSEISYSESGKIDTANYSEMRGEILSSNRPNPIFLLLRSKQKKKKQVLAALLAFPLPFGIVGLHRIYLGCSPYVPVAYIASLGGMFGVLPFIDFCVLLLDKETDRYSDNKKIFMWVN